LGTFGLDLRVDESGADLLADAEDLASQLASLPQDRGAAQRIFRELNEVQNRSIHSRADVDANLEDLYVAIDQAKTLRSPLRTSMRLALDELIRYWEARWFAY